MKDGTRLVNESDCPPRSVWLTSEFSRRPTHADTTDRSARQRKVRRGKGAKEMVNSARLSSHRKSPPQ
jgi:hypothetical protein